MYGLAPGRIVHYVLPEDDIRAGEVRPAVVVRVQEIGDTSLGCANLTVFLDGPRDSSALPITVEGADLLRWIPSVPYSEESKPGTWHWPPRA